MDWEFLIFTVIQIVITLVLFFLIKNYFPAYFTEKGKNVATKEDIEEITEKIKTVESKINIRSSGEIDYNALKRKIVLDYFGAYNNWERLIFHAYSSIGGDDYKSKNDSLLERINAVKFNYNLKEGEIEIFISESEFYELRSEVSLKLVGIQNEFEKHFSDVDFIIRGEANLTTRHNKLMQSKKEINDYRLEKLKELRPKRNLLISFLEKTLKESFN